MNPSVSIYTPDHKKPHRDSTGSNQETAIKASTPVGRPEEKSPRRTSLQVSLPTISAHSLPPSPSLLTPTGGADSPHVSDTSTAGERTPHGSKLTRKESYKAQRKNYRQEKKRVADELLNSLKDPSVIVLADWLKVRGSLKSWTKLYCILKPGLLLLYKSSKVKSNHWVGTVLLNACQVIERPSKKDGFCFKLFHPMEQSIWSPKGPEKETIGAVVQPLPNNYLIFRAPSQAAGKCWLDALELSLRCSSLLVRSISRQDPGDHEHAAHDSQWNETDFEKHFADYGTSNCNFLANLLRAYSPLPPDSPLKQLLVKGNLSPYPTRIEPSSPCPLISPIFSNLYRAVAELEKDVSIEKDLPSSDLIPRSDSLDAYCGVDLDFGSTDLGSGTCEPGSGGEQITGSDSESDCSVRDEDTMEAVPFEHKETPYVARDEGEIGVQGEQTEELADEHKSLIWYIVKQVRPGMDLSKVVLPTFILEPRSFLDRLSDSYYHADILAKAVLEDDAFTRMKLVVQWYLSGFYKKPKGLKKPYNPILGETFRCYWKHPNGSRTFYIAEQVSHHPPISAIYVTNRQDGFSISASILAKSKFYGNSTSAILEGVGVLTLLPRGEEYTMTVPYALCKGIIMGTLTMELGGKVNIECEKTGYKTELEFKLKPLIGGSDNINAISGKLRLGKEVLATIDGYWDGLTEIKDKRTGEATTLWNPTPSVRATRLVRYTVPISEQGNYESEKLWGKVSAAIFADDQVRATEEKSILEEMQREAAKDRKSANSTWVTKHFEQNVINGCWEYKHCDLRPWDHRNDLLQFESNYVIVTKTRHQTPMIRTSSVVGVDHHTINTKVHSLLRTDSRHTLSTLKNSKRRLTSASKLDSASSSQDIHSDSSHWETAKVSHSSTRRHTRLLDTVHRLESALDNSNERLDKLRLSIEQLARGQRERDRRSERQSLSIVQAETFLVIAIISLFQLLLVWVFFRRA